MRSLFYEQRTSQWSDTFYAGPICDHSFPRHVHDVVEIICLQKGSVEVTIGTQQLLLMPGDIAIAFPVVPHSYDYVSPDAEGLSLIFTPDAIVEFLHTFSTMRPVQPLLQATDKAPALNPLIDAMLNLSSRHGYHPLKLGYLHLFLSYLFTCMPLKQMDQFSQSGLPFQVLQYISEHFTEPLSLESTAHALGISRIHLSHIFSQQLHINFRQYINTLRIDRARTLLRNPSYTISQIVYLCGYGNPRTFHRAFQAQCGVAPNQYRSNLMEQK